MSRVFATDHIPIANRFRTSQEWNRELFGPSDLRRLTDEPFSARYAETTVGSVSLCEFETSPAENKILPRHRRSKSDASSLTLNIVISGSCYNEQLENSALVQPGDLFVADNHYRRSCRYPLHSSCLAIVVPRERLEQSIGPSRLYAGMVVGGGLPGASLVRDFFSQLLRVHDRASPEMVERLTAIGIDLILASLAEHMAIEAPKSIHGTVVVQRAHAYIKSNLDDPTLDAPRLAAAVGISLRRLQQLFSERGQHISDCIWQRRLETAAQRLADPAQMHLSIGFISYACGFASQAHFSRRFKGRYGVSPGDYRCISVQRRVGSLSRAL